MYSRESVSYESYSAILAIFPPNFYLGTIDPLNNTGSTEIHFYVDF